MTAEVAVMNRSAVALAADSTVSIGAPGRAKTYDTVNKLFTLSKVEPVGVMIYGNANFMGFPWETLIKSYRAASGLTRQKHTYDYCDDFLAHLKYNYEFTSEHESQNVFRICFRYVAGVDWLVVRRQHESSRLDEKGFRKCVLEVLDEQIRELQRRDDLLKTDASDLLKSYKDEINEAIKAVFGNRLTAAAMKRARRACSIYLQKDVFSSDRSGVVVAGFGTEEIFPSLVAHELDGVIAGEVKQKRAFSEDLDRDGTTALVKPFAQKEMVYRFMSGIDPDYREFLHGVSGQMMGDSCQDVLERYCSLSASQKSSAKAEILEAVEATIDSFNQRCNNYERDKFWKPILDMVDSLPKEEMANMAESLVNLTSLKRRVSPESNSVGGPIDVAVISKGDGFIWISRKHYFDPSLNPWFFQNYFRDIASTGGGHGSEGDCKNDE